MSYIVSKGGTFDDLTKTEADLLYEAMENLQKGVGGSQGHLESVFHSWCVSTGCQETPINLIVRFSFPALLSLVRYYRGPQT